MGDSDRCLLMSFIQEEYCRMRFQSNVPRPMQNAFPERLTYEDGRETLMVLAMFPVGGVT
jgi:hypothetical protein